MNTHRIILCLMILFADSPVWSQSPGHGPVHGPGPGPYSTEVLLDDPATFFLFEPTPPRDGRFVIQNLSRREKRGPDGSFANAPQIVDEPTGAVGNRVLFEGQSVFEIPHDPRFDSDELSIEFWFSSKQSWDQKYWPGSATLVSKFTAGWASSDWGILGGSLTPGINEGRILVGVGPQGGGDVVIASERGLNDGVVHHVVWTRSREGVNLLFVDGDCCATAKDSGGKITNTRPIQVGGEQHEQGGTFFHGELAALAMYPHVLTAERIQAHFAMGSIDPRLPPPANKIVEFVRDIKPIFQHHCYACHGPGKDQGGLSLTTRSLALDGGDSGRSIVPRKSLISSLVKRIAGSDETTVMPPEGERLSPEAVGLVRAWIDQGAVWPTDADEADPRAVQALDHWSFQPLSRPAIPTAIGQAPLGQAQREWGMSPIDGFILTKLNEHQLQPTRPATKAALLRRMTFDLTGLPPTPAEILAFERDDRLEACAEIVDKLLASPQYGERWARHWLDIVRYADSGGFETDIHYEQAWRYRDYVIRSLNEDKPYDQFLMEQVAGDELWPESAGAFADAIAVWTLGQWPNALDKFPEMLEYARRTDQVTTFSEALLGLTVGCANCHHHKYDPISQRDYFGLEAIFAASETWDQKTNKKAWSSGERSHDRVLRHAIPPTPIRLLSRGELTKPRGFVSPALPALFPGGGVLPQGPQESEQRRAHLARWLVAKENPLTARVIANRIWQWHFGEGLVATPNDFGTQGRPPTHPELLDWLATELVEHGWSLKHLHRRLLLSATYQQSTVDDPIHRGQNLNPIWLAGFPRRRLEAEEVWDHLHATAGTLQQRPFGTPFVPRLSPEELKGLYDIEQSPDKKWPVTIEQHRRAIYLLNRRSFRFPFFEAFDPPNNSVSCPKRQTTTIPAQALTLFNNPLVAIQAEAMSQRLMREAGPDPIAQVRLAWLLALSRQVSDPELQLAIEFLGEAETVHQGRGTTDPRTTALAEFCLGLINSSEFIERQ